MSQSQLPDFSLTTDTNPATTDSALASVIATKRHCLMLIAMGCRLAGHYLTLPLRLLWQGLSYLLRPIYTNFWIMFPFFMLFRVVVAVGEFHYRSRQANNSEHGGGLQFFSFMEDPLYIWLAGLLSSMLVALLSRYSYMEKWTRDFIKGDTRIKVDHEIQKHPFKIQLCYYSIVYLILLPAAISNFFTGYVAVNALFYLHPNPLHEEYGSLAKFIAAVIFDSGAGLSLLVNFLCRAYPDGKDNLYKMLTHRQINHNPSPPLYLTVFARLMQMLFTLSFTAGLYLHLRNAVPLLLTNHLGRLTNDALGWFLIPTEISRTIAKIVTIGPIFIATLLSRGGETYNLFLSPNAFINKKYEKYCKDANGKKDPVKYAAVTSANPCFRYCLWFICLLWVLPDGLNAISSGVNGMFLLLTKDIPNVTIDNAPAEITAWFMVAPYAGYYAAFYLIDFIAAIECIIIPKLKAYLPCNDGFKQFQDNDEEGLNLSVVSFEV